MWSNLAAVLAIMGAILVSNGTAREARWGNGVWVVSNLLWVAHAWQTGQTALAVQSAVFWALAVRGVVMWRRG